MDHTFNVQIATDFDIESAVFLNHMAFWTIKNIANDKHCHDGYYWTYNSHKAFTEIFPYWSYKQIERIILKLLKYNLIVKSNYNSAKYDRTCWYALSNEALRYFPSLISSISAKNTQIPKSGDAKDEIGRPIPNSKLQIKDLLHSVSGDTPATISTKQILDAYHEVLPECPKIKVADKKLLTQMASMKKNWPKYQKDGKIFSIDSFKDYLNFIKAHYSWFLAPYVTNSGRTKQNNLRVFTREINITKIVNGEFSAS